MSQKVIVLFGPTLGLGLVRSFGKIGKKVILLYNANFEIAQYSKFCLPIQCPDFYDYESLRDFLVTNKDRWEGALLIPSNDPQIEFLSKSKKELSKYYNIPVPDYKIIKKFLDKRETYRIAIDADIPVPATFYPETENEMIIFQENLRYPVMIKPVERHKFRPIFKKKLFIINSQKELFEKFSECLKHNLKVMITEIIPGRDTHIYQYTFYIDRKGNEVAGICQQKLRQTPPNYGVGRVTRTVDNPDIVVLSRKFIKNLPGFYGAASIEFKLDPRDGQYKLIEMNGRTPLQNWLFTKAGLNFARLYYQEWIKREQLGITDCRTGIYWIDLYNDIYDTLFSNKYESYSFWEYLHPYLSMPTFAIESLSDPCPMIRFWQRKIKNSVNFIKTKKYQNKHY